MKLKQLTEMVFVLALVGTSCSKNAQISGTAMDILSRRPLTGVLVKVDNPAYNITATTDRAGHYVLKNVPPGLHAVVALKEGFTRARDSVLAGEKARVVADTFWLFSPPDKAAGVYAIDDTEIVTLQAPSARFLWELNVDNPISSSPNFSVLQNPRAVLFYDCDGTPELWTVTSEVTTMFFNTVRVWQASKKVPTKTMSAGRCKMLLPDSPLEFGDYVACCRNRGGTVTAMRFFRSLANQPLDLEGED